MVSASLRWKIQRLRTMRVREICLRCMRSVRIHMESLGLGLAKRPPKPFPTFGQAWRHPLPPAVSAPQYIKDADRILMGKFSVFELKDLDLGFPPIWNLDPKLEVMVPLRFGKTLDYRSGNDILYTRYLVELNRHLELVRLAQAYALTQNLRYGEGCRDLLQSWFEQSPYPMGANWNNSLEHGIRLANWAVSWHLLGGAESSLFRGKEGAAFQRRWLDSVYQHCHFIASHLSLHSSANNHLFGEYMGLFIAALTWPCWPRSDNWRDLAHRGLEEETLKQVGSDGVHREQSASYHREVATMMLVAGLFARANAIGFSQQYWHQLEAMLDFLASMMDSGGHVPMIGDADDAEIVGFAPHRGKDLYLSLLATGATLFRRADFKQKAREFGDAERWLTGDAEQSLFDALPVIDQAKPPRRSFPEAGYYILGMDFGACGEVRLVVDSGPLGYLSIAAHGHADALAFTLSIDGKEFLVDPGTYAYGESARWRDFFRGTSAHNTVRVDGVDQSVSGGAFLWVKHAKAWCERFESGEQREFWQGVHDGYRRLSDPVLHRRAIEVDKKRRGIRITDTLECKGPHQAEIYWHFSELCEVHVQGAEVLSRNGRAELRMRMDNPGWQTNLVRGDEGTPQGWVSRCYGIKVPAPTILFSGKFEGLVELVTECSITIRTDKHCGEQSSHIS